MLSSCLLSTWFKDRSWGIESPSLHWASTGLLFITDTPRWQESHMKLLWRKDCQDHSWATRKKKKPMLILKVFFLCWCSKLLYTWRKTTWKRQTSFESLGEGGLTSWESSPNKYALSIEAMCACMHADTFFFLKKFTVFKFSRWSIWQ